MSEELEMWLLPIRIAAFSLFVYFYVLGGRNLKVWRRYVGSTVMIALLTLISLINKTFSLWLFFPFVLLYISLMQGYGDDTFLRKIVKRFSYGFLLGSVGLSIGLITGNLELGVMQFLLSVISSIYFGIRNPFPAVREEALIASFSVLIIVYML